MIAVTRAGYAARMTPPEGMTYASAGVDIDAGDRLVDLIKPMVRRTHGPRVMGQHGAFASMFRLDLSRACSSATTKTRYWSHAPMVWAPK